MKLKVMWTYVRCHIHQPNYVYLYIIIKSCLGTWQHPKHLLCQSLWSCSLVSWFEPSQPLRMTSVLGSADVSSIFSTSWCTVHTTATCGSVHSFRLWLSQKKSKSILFILLLILYYLNLWDQSHTSLWPLSIPPSHTCPLLPPQKKKKVGFLQVIAIT